MQKYGITQHNHTKILKTRRKQHNCTLDKNNLYNTLELFEHSKNITNLNICHKKYLHMTNIGEKILNIEIMFNKLQL